MVVSVSKSREELPYLNNLPMALMICAINLVLAFAFQYGKRLEPFDLVLDAAICGVVTAFTSLWYAHWAVKSRRAHGALPAQVPLHPHIRHLPKRLLPLATLTGAVGAALMALITLALIRFYPETDYTFPRFLVWKMIYSTVLAAKMIEFGILRYVQPDCAGPNDPEQRGQQTVRNPLPRWDVFKQLYNSATTDFGMNMLIGVALGGTLIQGNLVILQPVYQSGVWISGLALGIIVSFLMVKPTLAGVHQAALAGGLPAPPKTNRLLAALPAKPLAFTGVLIFPVMVVSAFCMWAVLTFFGFFTLNFFQYFVIRTAYTKLLSKGVGFLAVHRYKQLGVGALSAPEAKEVKVNV